MRIDVYFTEYLLAAEIDEKGHTETLFFRRNNKKHQRKKLGCKFVRINTSKEGYDAEYEASRIETFISEFEDRRLKKSNELEDKIEKLTIKSLNKIKMVFSNYKKHAYVL